MHYLKRLAEEALQLQVHIYILINIIDSVQYLFIFITIDFKIKPNQVNKSTNDILLGNEFYEWLKALIEINTRFNTYKII